MHASKLNPEKGSFQEGPKEASDLAAGADQARGPGQKQQQRGAPLRAAQRLEEVHGRDARSCGWCWGILLLLGLRATKETTPFCNPPMCVCVCVLLPLDPVRRVWFGWQKPR